MNSKNKIGIIRRLAAAAACLVICAATGHAQITVVSAAETGTLGVGSQSDLFDGNLTTFQQWLSSGSVTMNLGSSKTVDRLVVYNRQGISDYPGVTTGSVQVSTDNVNWTTVVNNRILPYNGTGFGVVSLGFAAQSAQYIKVYIDQPTNAQIGELQVFNGNGPNIGLIAASKYANESYADLNQIVNPTNANFALMASSLTETNYLTFSLTNAALYGGGWNQVVLKGRSGANPAKIVLQVSTDGSTWSNVYDSGTLALAASDWTYTMSTGVQTDNYMRMEFIGGVNGNNIQLYSADVVGVPEPSSVALLLLAGPIFVCLRKRRAV